MSDTPDSDDLRMRKAIREAVAMQKRSTQMRAAGQSAAAARAQVRRRREAWAERLRDGRHSLTTMEAELDRMARFDDLFSALVLKPKRR